MILHGGPGCPSDYLFGLAELSAHYNVVFYDQLGCGRSSHDVPTEALTIEQFAKDLQQLIEYLALDRLVFLCHSFGGTLAMQHQKDQPTKVQKLILVSPLICTDDWQQDVRSLINKMSQTDQDGLQQPTDSTAYQQAEEHFYQRYFCKLEPWPDLLLETMNNLSKDVYETMWGANEFTSTGNLQNANYVDVLTTLSCPVLFICGSEDEARPNTLQKYANLCKHSDLEVFAGSTHCVHLEQPHAFMDKVMSFLKGT